MHVQHQPAEDLESQTKSMSQKHRLRSWIASAFLAILFHVAMWWLPIELPLLPKQKLRTIQLSFAATKPLLPPPVRRPEEPKPLRPTPPRPRVKKRRIRPKKRRIRRKRRMRRRPIPRPVQRPTPRREVPKPTPRPTQRPKVPTPLPRPAPRPIQRPTPRRKLPKPAPRPTQRKTPAAGPAKPVNLGPYRGLLNRKIQRHKRYPRIAHRMGFEGLVVLVIRVSQTGALLGKPNIARSSGHKVLDREAIRMVVAAAPFPKLPNRFSRKYATFRLPVNFSLE